MRAGTPDTVDALASRFARSLRAPAPPAAIALVIGGALRFLFLGSRSLWFDEALTLLVASRPLSLTHSFLMRFEVSPPLYSVLMHAWIRLFADPRIGLRVFSAACGIGALIAFRDLSRRLLPEGARLPALFLAAASSYWLHFAQDGRVYALLTLIVVCEARLTLELTERPTRRLWAAYAAVAALGLYAHYYFGLILAAHAAWLLRRWRRSPRELAALFAAHGCAAAAFLPWLGSLMTQFGMHRGDLAIGEPLGFRHLCGLIGTVFFDVTYLGLILPSWFVPAVGAGVLATCAAAGVRLARQDGEAAERGALDFLLWHAAAFVALVGAAEFVCGRPVTQARYFAPVAPFLYLLAALELSRGGRAAAAGRRALGALVVAGTAGYFISGLVVDPRLGALAATVRGTDRRLPLVYLDTYYYLPMRNYYLLERPHFLVAEASEGVDYPGLPPYDGVLGPDLLRRLGPCVVLDEKRWLGGPALSIADGAQVAALIARSPLAAKRRPGPAEQR
ncbi:MAG: glycosyltransferase family 39 protein [Elusimicrobia bacterium]|nr:glycosyltransferase family 39 protein [Elusimicrobiota bacterium]